MLTQLPLMRIVVAGSRRPCSPGSLALRLEQGSVRGVGDSAPALAVAKEAGAGRRSLRVGLERLLLQILRISAFAVSDSMSGGPILRGPFGMIAQEAVRGWS